MTQQPRPKEVDPGISETDAPQVSEPPGVTFYHGALADIAQETQKIAQANSGISMVQVCVSGVTDIGKTLKKIASLAQPAQRPSKKKSQSIQAEIEGLISHVREMVHSIDYPGLSLNSTIQRVPGDHAPIDFQSFKESLNRENVKPGVPSRDLRKVLKDQQVWVEQLLTNLTSTFSCLEQQVKNAEINVTHTLCSQLAYTNTASLAKALAQNIQDRPEKARQAQIAHIEKTHFIGTDDLQVLLQ